MLVVSTLGNRVRNQSNHITILMMLRDIMIVKSDRFATTES
jgi:hypothetical protein